jgi:hypothetical protein
MKSMSKHMGKVDFKETAEAEVSAPTSADADSDAGRRKS